MDGRKERAVEPPATLGNELGNSVGHIRRGLGALYILQAVNGDSRAIREIRPLSVIVILTSNLRFSWSQSQSTEYDPRRGTCSALRASAYKSDTRPKPELTEKTSAIGTTTVHCFSFEIGRKRAFPIGAILQRLIPVRAECSGQHTNIAEDALSMVFGTYTSAPSSVK